MVCPSCQGPTRVLESRRGHDGAAVRRRRECSGCGHRFTTFERREPDPVQVIKRDGERQRFDHTKLRAALLRAAHKRPVSAEQVERLVERIEAEGGEAGGELSAERIAELSLNGLRELDAGAYLQFAGTLAEPPFAISGDSGPDRPGRSVRPDREDAQSTVKAASRRGFDE